MAAADNPYFIQPPNVYQALMSGVGAYNAAEKSRILNDAATSLQQGEDIKNVLGRVMQVDPEAAKALATFSHQRTQEELQRLGLSQTGTYQQAQIAHMNAQQALAEKAQQEGKIQRGVTFNPLTNEPAAYELGPQGGKMIPFGGTDQPSTQIPTGNQSMNLTAPGTTITGVQFADMKQPPINPNAPAAVGGPPSRPFPTPEKITTVMQKYGGTPDDGKNWAFLATLPDQIQERIVRTTTHDVNPTSYSTRMAQGAGNSPRGALTDAATMFDRTYNQQDYPIIQKARAEFGPAGQSGRTVRSLNVVVDHLGTLRDLAMALDNGNVRAANNLYQTLAKQFGGAAPTNLAQANKIVGTEIIKAMGVAGAGAEGERAGFELSQASSPAQSIGVIDQVARPLLGGQLRGLQKQFVETTKRPVTEFNNLLFPQTLKFLGGGEPQGDSNARVVIQNGNRFQVFPDGTSKFLGAQ